MSNEVFGVKTRPSKELQLSRKIRPFRHAYIRLIKPVSTSLTWEYANGINEFGEGLIVSVTDGTGEYVIEFNPSAFKNLDNVIQEVEIVHSTLALSILPIVTSAFANNEKIIHNTSVFDLATSLNIDIDGELLLTLREFYD